MHKLNTWCFVLCIMCLLLSKINLLFLPSAFREKKCWKQLFHSSMLQKVFQKLVHFLQKDFILLFRFINDAWKDFKNIFDKNCFFSAKPIDNSISANNKKGDCALKQFLRIAKENYSVLSWSEFSFSVGFRA